jgi:hypothetical protein
MAMDLLSYERVTAWLDELAPDQGAFAHALEWAGRLGLPLCGRDPSLKPRHADQSRAERIQACGSACARHGVAWEAPAVGAACGPRPVELNVIGDALPPAVRAPLLRWSLIEEQTSVLVCPRAWRPVSRVLVLNPEREPGGHFLADVLQLCRAFAATPVVLTVARTEVEARRRQRSAEEAFAAALTPADFDIVVGCEVRAAVARVACWRRCSHVFLAKDNSSPWQRWLRGDGRRRLVGASDCLAFLALPAARPFGPAGDAASRRPEDMILPHLPDPAAPCGTRSTHFVHSEGE